MVFLKNIANRPTFQVAGLLCREITPQPLHPAGLGANQPMRSPFTQRSSSSADATYVAGDA